MGNFHGGKFNLYGNVNLRRSDFDHSNLFQCQKQHSVNIEHWLKSKLTCVYKEYEIKTKMVQEQWLQLKMKFLLGYNMKIVKTLLVGFFCTLRLNWQGSWISAFWSFLYVVFFTLKWVLLPLRLVENNQGKLCFWPFLVTFGWFHRWWDIRKQTDLLLCLF